MRAHDCVLVVLEFVIVNVQCFVLGFFDCLYPSILCPIL